jgi:hypothetical protein
MVVVATSYVRRPTLLSLGLLTLLWHCSLASEGQAPPVDGTPTNGSGGSGQNGAGQGGTGGGGVQGTGGGVQGTGGVAGSGGGNAGSGGAGGDAGDAGSGGEAGGMAGTAGGGPVECDAAKGEFEVAGEAGSCFFLLAEKAKVQPTSGRKAWTWDQARDDCAAFGNTTKLASLATLQVYQQVRDYLRENGEDLAGLSANSKNENVWLGGSTELGATTSKNTLAASFTWVDGEKWAFATASQPPWGDDAEPSIDGPSDTVTEKCLEMRNDYAFDMNNIPCDEPRSFALCRRRP